MFIQGFYLDSNNGWILWSNENIPATNTAWIWNSLLVEEASADMVGWY